MSEGLRAGPDDKFKMAVVPLSLDRAAREDGRSKGRWTKTKATRGSEAVEQPFRTERGPRAPAGQRSTSRRGGLASVYSRAREFQPPKMADPIKPVCVELYLSVLNLHDRY